MNPPFDLKSRFHSVAEIHSAFLSQKVTAVALAQEYLSRIDASPHNAFITVSVEQALSLAEKADAAMAKLGPESAIRAQALLGIPTAIKDNLQWQGVRTTCASRILGDYHSPYTAKSVQALLDAGAVILGKTNLDEFAMGGSNENSAFGPVLHPTHLDRVPGGSSGGSAAAVGAGLCVIALGSDTGGSIRLPASYCGITGFKPTYGRVSRWGLVAFASSLDQVGPMARTLEDCALVDEIVSGWDEKDSTCIQIERAGPPSQPLDRPVRVGIPREYFQQGLSVEVERVLQASILRLRQAGVEVREVSFPASSAVISTYYLIAVSEASSNLSRFDGVRYGARPSETEASDSLDDFYKKVRTQFGPEVKRRILFGTYALSKGYADAYYRKACEAREWIRQDLDRIFEEVDWIMGPVAPTTAYLLGEKTRDPLEMYLNDLFTIPANLAGLPALSVPVGVENQTELPIGIQLQGPRGKDRELLSFARANFSFPEKLK